MHPPVKDQTDIGRDNPTIDASDGAEIPDQFTREEFNKDTARQEFKEEADVNHMLSKFSITPERGAPTYGEWDDTMDLQQALQSVAEARAAYTDLPDEIKAKFSSMEELLKAYNNGSFVIKDGDVPVPPKTELEILQERYNDLEKRLLENRPA